MSDKVAEWAIEEGQSMVNDDATQKNDTCDNCQISDFRKIAKTKVSWKNHSGAPIYNLPPGRGYLYKSKNALAFIQESTLLVLIRKGSFWLSMIFIVCVRAIHKNSSIPYIRNRESSCIEYVLLFLVLGTIVTGLFAKFWIGKKPSEKRFQQSLANGQSMLIPLSDIKKIEIPARDRFWNRNNYEMSLHLPDRIMGLLSLSRSSRKRIVLCLPEVTTRSLPVTY